MSSLRVCTEVDNKTHSILRKAIQQQPTLRIFISLASISVILVTSFSYIGNGGRNSILGIPLEWCGAAIFLISFKLKEGRAYEYGLT
jgi:hypothetical protein